MHPLQIHSKISLSDDQRAYIHEKLEKILHFSGRADDESSMIKVHLEDAHTQDKKNHIYAKVNIIVPKGDFHTDCYAQTVEAAIDICEERLKPQVQEYKAKHQR